MSGCDWCGYEGSGWDGVHVPHRIDPPGCGCTDCLFGWSKPRDKASTYELFRAIPADPRWQPWWKGRQC